MEKMVHSSNINKGNYTMKPEVNKIFDDLEAYLDFCRFNLLPFNPAELYRKDSANYIAYQNSKRPRKPWNNNNRRSHGQSFSN